MAIDTTEKKLSLLNYGVPWKNTLPEADASIDQGDKQHFLNLYAGILSTESKLYFPVALGYYVPGGQALDHHSPGGQAADVFVPGGVALDSKQ